jgi:molybdate/tungstate transport system ATP-binding protein
VISLEKVAVRAGAFSLEGVSFEVAAGAYAVLMGKTGSGKTTLLEAVCGLRPVASGRIFVGGRDVTALRPGDRGLAYVPQDRALFWTMTVREHLEFAPSIRKWEPRAIADRVEELAGLLGIAPLLDRRPAGLSGGEAQRVALGRALAARPDTLLLDEPLSALDEETREGMFTLLDSVRKKSPVTVVHVTHSHEEARRLADKVYLLRGGAVREASPADLEEQRR